MAKRDYESQHPYDRKPLKVWLSLEQLKKLDNFCKGSGVSKKEVVSKFVDQLVREVELTEKELEAIEEEKQERIERGFYVPHD